MSAGAFLVRAINANPRGLMEFGLFNLKRLAQGKLKVMDHGAIHGLLLDGQFEASLILPITVTRRVDAQGALTGERNAVSLAGLNRKLGYPAALAG